MINLLLILLLPLIILGRVLHGRGGDKWYQSKWVIFSPSLLFASALGFYNFGVLGLSLGAVVALGIVLFFSGAVADNTLNYMYRVVNSNIRNIVISVSWRIALCVLLVVLGSISNPSYLFLGIPMILSLYPLIHVAKENRHITGKMDDGNHRKNVEISEGLMGAINICSVLAVILA